jgi:hypothetical protein
MFTIDLRISLTQVFPLLTLTTTHCLKYVQDLTCPCMPGLVSELKQYHPSLLPFDHPFHTQIMT